MPPNLRSPDRASEVRPLNPNPNPIAPDPAVETLAPGPELAESSRPDVPDPEAPDDPSNSAELPFWLKREARIGIAALVSFLILVTVLVVNKGRSGKLPPVARIEGAGDASASAATDHDHGDDHAKEKTKASASATRSPSKLADRGHEAEKPEPKDSRSGGQEVGPDVEKKPDETVSSDALPALPRPADSDSGAALTVTADAGVGSVPRVPEPTAALPSLTANEPGPTLPSPPPATDAPLIPEPLPGATADASPATPPSPSPAMPTGPVVEPTGAPAALADGGTMSPVANPTAELMPAPTPAPTPAPAPVAEVAPEPVTPSAPDPNRHPADPAPIEANPAPVPSETGLAPPAGVDPMPPTPTPHDPNQGLIRDQAASAPAPAPESFEPLVAKPLTANPFTGKDQEGWVALPNASARGGASSPEAQAQGGSGRRGGLGLSAMGVPAAAVGAAAVAAGSLASGLVDPVPHVVQSGENFWTIARLYYGSGRFYKALWKANSALVPAPEKLRVGQTIRIPPPEALDRSLILPPRSTQGSGSRAGADTSLTLPIHRTSRPVADAEVPAARELALPVVDPFAGSGHSRGGSGRRGLASGELVPAQEMEPANGGDPTAPAPPRRPLYKVRPNETLRSIARDTLGDSRRAGELLELNRDVIDDTGRPAPGQVIELPEDARTDVRAR